MVNYEKWDKIAESSDEDEEEAVARTKESIHSEEIARRIELKEGIERWLRRQVQRLPRDGEDGAPRSAEKRPPVPIRKLTDEERRTVAMFMAMTFFEEGETNLERHADLINMVRQHRWLEEDPGTLELMCRVHHNAMRQSDKATEGSEDRTMREMLMCAINTIAAPKRCGCAGGLYELCTLICTPSDDKGKECRKKYQKKEYAKDALFDSLFPDLRHFAEDEKDDDSSDFWIFLVMGILAIVAIVAMVLLYNNIPRGPRGRRGAKNVSNITSAIVDVVKDAAAAGLSAAAGAAGGASASAAAAPAQGNLEL